MRIAVDPGGLQSSGFDSISQEVEATAATVIGALTGAAGAAGNASLAAALGALSDALAGADRSAALTIASLGTAVANAGISYQRNEEAIARAEGLG